MAVIKLGQEQSAKRLPQVLCVAEFFFSVGPRSISLGQQGVAILLGNHIETTGPGHEVIVAFQEIRPPTSTATIDRVDEVEGRMTAKKADVIDRFLRVHDLNIVLRNDLNKSGL